MAAEYSNTKINTFKQCRCKYKLQYIDKVTADRTRSIETFLGSMAHETLEKLYRDKSYCKDDSLEEILAYYDKIWDENYDDTINIAKKEFTVENYREIGRKCITEYYRSHEPFDEMKILGLETDDVLILPNGRTYSIRIDKLGCTGNEYYVCDYKTDSRLKTKEEADNDRQLAMYSVWVKQNFPDATGVHLVWHMLKFDKDVTSERTDEQLKALVDEIVADIETIESCTEWPTTVSHLCDYCEFKKHCPEFKHECLIEFIEPEKLTEDEAYNAVNEYTEIERQMKIIKKQSDELAEKKKVIAERLIGFANANGCSTVYGETMKCSISRSDSVILIEEKKEQLKDVLIKEGRSDYLQLATTAIQSMVRKNEADELINDYVVINENYKVTSSKREKTRK